MKSKILTLALLFSLIAGFAIAEGGQEDKGSAAMTASGPQYGGTLTVIHQRSKGDPPSPAQKDSQVQAIEGWLAAMQEHGILGDYRNFGGMSTGEFMFEFSDYIPWKYTKGQLFESWELTPTYALINVRKGVYWAPNKAQQAWMPVRELVAEDIAFDINTFWGASWGTRFNGILAMRPTRSTSTPYGAILKNIAAISCITSVSKTGRYFLLRSLRTTNRTCGKTRLVPDLSSLIRIPSAQI
jgi:hypothetical protein